MPLSVLSMRADGDLGSWVLQVSKYMKPKILFSSYPNKFKSNIISLRASDSYTTAKSMHAGLHF